jgi:anti-sigma factor RsiW
MSLTPSHEELEEMLPAAALDILQPAELEQVLAYVRNHPECAKLLQEYRDAAAALALELPGRQLDPVRARALRARLMARARTDPAAPLSSSRRPSSIIYQWSGWMVAAGLASVLLLHHSVHRPLDYGWLATGALLAILTAVGIYARVQRGRATALEHRVADLERRTPNS